MFKKSLLGLKSPRTISTVAMMIAVYAVLYSVKIPIAVESRVSITFLPVMLTAYLLGAAPAMIVGAVGDILSMALFPSGQYFPGFTLSAMLGGCIYGLVLYQRKGDIRLRVAVAVLLVVLLINCGLNTLWLSVLYKKAFLVFLVSRIFLNLTELPIMMLLGIIMLDAAEKTGIMKKYIVK